MNPSLKDKIALITGAGSGLGQHTALLLAAQGVRVIAVGRQIGPLNETVQAVLGAGGWAQAIPADVSRIESVKALKAEIERRCAGVVSILVNAAGVFGPIQLVKDGEPHRWVETVAINLFGPYLLCHAFVGDMIRTGWGRIVNFSSAASLHPPGPFDSAYATSKTALNRFTRHLAAELKGTGVTANALHPGDVKTEMWAAIRREVEALGPEAEVYRNWVQWVDATGGDPPQKAAQTVLALMRDEAASINGQFLWIENGLKAPLPSWDNLQSVPE